MASTRHPRTRTGCWICRLRKKKCDETRPICQQCRGLRILCDGYDVAQPAWMRDPVEMKRKKDEIKLQIGKRGRRRKKALARRAELDLRDEENSMEGKDGSLVGDGDAAEMNDSEGLPDRNQDGQPFVFETTDLGIQLLKPFQENPKGHTAHAVAMLDSPRPPIGWYRCPVRNSFARGVHQRPGYGIFDACTGKPLLEDIRSGVIFEAKQPLWKSTQTTCSNTRTKEEEIYDDDYDAIIALFKSSSKHQTQFGPSEFSDPSLIPPVNFAKTHELNLVEHYIRNVFRLSYAGMSEARIRDSLREVFVPLLCTNPGLIKGCMSSSAIHLARERGRSKPSVKALLVDAWRYRLGCVQDLKKRLTDEGVSEQTLVLVLTLTSFEVFTSFSSWKPHLQAAIECLVQLDLLNRPTHSAISKFLMSRVIWLDILSSVTLGRAPQLWANYREILSRPERERSYCGLLDMMGCDDTVMLLISEVMCVEDYKFRALKDGIISWERGSKRAMELDGRLRDRDLPITMKLPPSPEPPFSSLAQLDKDDEDYELGDAASFLVSPSPSPSSTISGSPESIFDGDSATTSSPLSPITPITPPSATPSNTLALSKGIVKEDSDSSIPPGVPCDQGMIVKVTTAAFRTASRIHLWSIGLGFYPRLNFFKQLLEELIVMVALIPVDLSSIVAWPLLIGGCIATEQKDRDFFLGRCAHGYGDSLRGVEKVMREVWRRSDESDRELGVGCGQEVHWRSVMRDQNMEILLV